MTLASIAKFLTKPFSDNGKPSINHFTSLKSAKTETQSYRKDWMIKHMPQNAQAAAKIKVKRASEKVAK